MDATAYISSAEASPQVDISKIVRFIRTGNRPGASERGFRERAAFKFEITDLDERRVFYLRNAFTSSSAAVQQH